jgi:hypothetical protein
LNHQLDRAYGGNIRESKYLDQLLHISQSCLSQFRNQNGVSKETHAQSELSLPSNALELLHHMRAFHTTAHVVEGAGGGRDKHNRQHEEDRVRRATFELGT